jgi:hypothetical protein
MFVPTLYRELVCFTLIACLYVSQHCNTSARTTSKEAGGRLCVVCDKAQHGIPPPITCKARMYTEPHLQARPTPHSACPLPLSSRQVRHYSCLLTVWNRKRQSFVCVLCMRIYFPRMPSSKDFFLAIAGDRSMWLIAPYSSISNGGQAYDGLARPVLKSSASSSPSTLSCHCIFLILNLHYTLIITLIIIIRIII